MIIIKRLNIHNKQAFGFKTYNNNIKIIIVLLIITTKYFHLK